MNEVEINYFYASMPNTAIPLQNMNFDAKITQSINIQLNAGIVFKKGQKLTIQFLLNSVINVAGNVPDQDSYIVENDTYRGVSVSAGLNIVLPKTGSKNIPLQVVVMDLETGKRVAIANSNLHLTAA